MLSLPSIGKYLSSFLLVLRASFYRMVANFGIEHAGYMAFVLLLSLFPFLVICLLFAHLLNLSSFNVLFLQILEQYIGHEITLSIKEPLQKLITIPPQELITVFLISYAWTSTSLIEGLRTILNRIYGVYNPPRYLFRRLLSLLQFFILVFLVLTFMSIMFFLPKFYSHWPFFQINNHFYLSCAQYIMLFFFIASLYVFIPNTKIKFLDVVPGSVITIVLLRCILYVYSKYFGVYAKANVIYGSLGNIILTLIMFYIINLAFIYGAEINYYICFKRDVGTQSYTKN